MSNYSGGSYAGSSFQVEEKGEDDEHQQVGAHQLLAGPLKPCHGWTTCYAFLTLPKLVERKLLHNKTVRRCVATLCLLATAPSACQPQELVQEKLYIRCLGARFAGTRAPED